MEKKRILIVEDDEDIQTIYYEIISDTYDVDIDQQYNGKDGLEAVKKNKPDLVILDLLMPIMNGEEFLKNFRHTLHIKDVPVIICSVNQTLAHELMSRGDAEAVLPKLFMENEMIKTLGQLLHIEPKSTTS